MFLHYNHYINQIKAANECCGSSHVLLCKSKRNICFTLLPHACKLSTWRPQDKLVKGGVISPPFARCHPPKVSNINTNLAQQMCYTSQLATDMALKVRV